MNIKYICYILLLVLTSAAGCGGGKAVSPEYDEPSLSADESLDVAQLAGRRPATLAELVRFSASQQYSPLESIYNRPPEGMNENYFVQLVESNEVVNLADRVATYLQKDNILAIGLDSGLIKLYGGSGCGALQTAAKPVRDISWFSRSNILAATSGDSSEVEVFKVNECVRVRVADVNSTVDMFAVSPKGTWLAVVDEARRLFVGPSEGRMRQIYRFLHKPLSLSFSDEEGILMAVDVSGQLNMWSPLKLSRIYEFKIEGGPFKSVESEGPFLNIVTEKGDRFRWDVGQRARSSYHEKSSGFDLRNGVLSYTSPRKRLSRKVFFRPAELAVERSAAKKIFRIRDIDGEQRFYSEITGEALKSAPESTDWKKVRLDGNYKFSERGHEYVLAEPIAQREFQRLYCRYIPSKGYFLWWVKVARPDDYFNSRGMVPRRDGISATSPVKWFPLEDKGLDIRD
ncbi:WD40 repeat domain-containing protein [Maridesulfovibrio sp. FT414]|uniref:WD40 repeat domain-containing protein n=1 Tax=Maridesulfovibrio sp. FT414 TaxID=2979469 RepID=UPI003D802648